ncbi:hypothetical protein OS493_009152 [Desmophyllum pertusum]|uniref:Uncharacterized protein n=1 Tax=Desmophyllum pertusum TaxID=174260 RepID=A0A9X0CSA0_9CNID|nr:hypothetical protein OS493_009152 [Desmophyllum pertusum]
MSMSWVRSPASYQTWQQPGYHGYNPVTTIPSHYFNTQLAAPSNLNPYQQNIISHPQGESNSFFIPPYHHVSSPPSYLQATTRNLVGFVTPHSLPGIAANLPRLSHHIYHYPRVFSRPRHHQFTRGPFSRSFPRHQEFPDVVLNSLRDLNLQ